MTSHIAIHLVMLKKEGGLQETEAFQKGLQLMINVVNGITNASVDFIDAFAFLLKLIEEEKGTMDELVRSSTDLVGNFRELFGVMDETNERFTALELILNRINTPLPEEVTKPGFQEFG